MLDTLGYKAVDGPLVPLVLTQECCVVPEVVEENIRATLSRPYVSFDWRAKPGVNRLVSICGFGPSFKETWPVASGDIWACNGAHDYLLERGVIPKYGMFWDASPVVSRFITPHKDVTYLVASRCHESVFQALEGYDVRVWHAKGDECVQRILEDHNRMEPMIHGGSTCVTRALVLASVMGYRAVRLFGADGSYEGDLTHVRKSIVDEQELNVYCAGRWFKSTPWLAAQAEDFKVVAIPYKDAGYDIKLYGDGLTPHVAKLNGFEVI